MPMIRIRRLPMFGWPVIAASYFGVGCQFDTTPVIRSSTDTSVAAQRTRETEPMLDLAGGSAAVPVIAPPAPQPPAAGQNGVAVDAGMPMPSGMPAAPSGGMPAPARLPDPVSMPVGPPPHCQGMNSYGLRITADLAWDSSNGLTTAGRGPAEIYAKLDVQDLAADSGALHATARVCGIVLPPSSGPLNCGPRQLRFADDLWNNLATPSWNVLGQYTCAAEGCTLQLAPSAYDIGIGGATSTLFPDDDGDGAPGVSVNIAVPPSDPDDASCGTWPTWGTPVSTDSIDHLRIGLHADLQGTLRVAADCSVTDAAGAVDALVLHAADCAPSTSLWGASQVQATDAGSPSTTTGCSADQRAIVDESLPRYSVLSPNEMPAAVAVARDNSPSPGTALRAFRFLPGQAVDCDQVRKAMY